MYIIGSLIVYAVILNQKLINKNKKKDRNFKQHTKKKRKKEGEKETVKLTTDIDRPYTMVRFAHLKTVAVWMPIRTPWTIYDWSYRQHGQIYCQLSNKNKNKTSTFNFSLLINVVLFNKTLSRRSIDIIILFNSMGCQKVSRFSDSKNTR